MKVFAVLIDTVSIQKYIFASNYLKENIGASFLVGDIYEKCLRESVKDVVPSATEEDFEDWRDEKRSGVIRIKECGSEFEVGYIGGGNALLFFKEFEKAKKFIRDWTKRLLIYAPGIIPAVACREVDISKFVEEKDLVFALLHNNKNYEVMNTVIKRHGITADCPRTGYSRDVWCEKLPSDDKDYISSVSYAKIAATDEAKKKLEVILKDIGLDDKYTFTDNFEKLGQSVGDENYIAIVHIDGNDMGDRFREQKTLKDIRNLSSSVEMATIKSFKDLLLEIDKSFDNIKRSGIKIGVEENKNIIPLRPIIIGGDDITFVCDGRLGIYFAKIFIEKFMEKNVSDGKPLTACAGVAIIKTSYPFYRGYELSEELCKQAKQKRKDNRDTGSYIDWHLSYGGFSGDIITIREAEYNISNKYLLMRPYRVDALNDLLVSVKKFKEKQFPNSKIMKLRETLYSSETNQRFFIEELKARNISLPEYREFNGTTFFMSLDRNNNDRKLLVTPYLDMIDLIKLYPETLL